MVKKIFFSILISIIFFAQNVFCENSSVLAKSESENGIILEHDTPGIYIFKLNTKKIGSRIKPYSTEKLTTVSDVYKNNENFALVVNGGFFDPATGGAISYVIIDGKKTDTPFSNLGLIKNADKSNRLEAILNRAELRILEDNKGKLTFDITNHFAPVEEGKTIRHSLQAGPLVYPNMNLEKESFVIKENDKVVFQAADVLKKRERTVLGLKGDILYLIIFTKQNKVTLNEIYDFCKNLKLEKAMALDGGTSTSLNYKDIEIFSGFGNQRKVKSFLIIEK